MTLATFWFVVLAVLWTGFLVLDGFDFGVGMLAGVIGRDDVGRRVAINTIGPVWDANEVWLIVAGAGMFAAFPSWYATMFSGFYPTLVLLLVALIGRGLSFEFRGKRDAAGWRRSWDAAMAGGSLLAPLLVGVALGNLLHGVPIGADQEYAGNLLDLLNGYALFTGVTVVLVCLLHGATFLALRTTGDVRERAVRAARRIGPVTVCAVLAFAVWTQVSAGKGLPSVALEVIAVLAVAVAGWFAFRSRGELTGLAGGDTTDLAGCGGTDLAAFAATSLTMAATISMIFVDLYPRVMVSTLGPANDLTVTGTASSSYSLRVMTVVVAVLLPVVLAYQAWTYHVFRRRISRSDIVPPPRQTPAGTAATDPAATTGNSDSQQEAT
ncbi:cytochrome d ubiquinol oxidase subunit II [Frankia sp. Cppng1_Ct_nod]|uniref:cytochrome d ubiquinol oxidase subunit II n=1 Tax=Frankia sp. Cppng1_Ct_nod TaxID=2897162 RepID=UPI001041853B|nr:cytochrome d ubiquinol oxidase subunit II [Frankia sp. Cppng1_Ct_nod]